MKTVAAVCVFMRARIRAGYMGDMCSINDNKFLGKMPWYCGIYERYALKEAAVPTAGSTIRVSLSLSISVYVRRALLLSLSNTLECECIALLFSIVLDIMVCLFVGQNTK